MLVCPTAPHIPAPCIPRDSGGGGGWSQYWAPGKRKPSSYVDIHRSYHEIYAFRPSLESNPAPPASGRPRKPLCYTNEVRIHALQAEQAGPSRRSVYLNPPRGSNHRLRHVRPAAYHSSTGTTQACTTSSLTSTAWWSGVPTPAANLQGTVRHGNTATNKLDSRKVATLGLQDDR